jgi:hypothetical protein
MRNSIWNGKRTVSALFALGLFLSSLGGARAGTSSSPSVPDLTGDWTLTAGGIPGTIHISSSGTSGGFP